jgi:hypothetical protein
MRPVPEYFPIVSLCVGGWGVLNGIWHDVFVLRAEHGRTYDRNLLRLLMDGHILIACGAIQMIAFKGLQANEQWALPACGIAGLSLLLYCAMIFPFLKSIVTITLNSVMLFMAIVGLLLTN